MKIPNKTENQTGQDSRTSMHDVQGAPAQVDPQETNSGKSSSPVPATPLNKVGYTHMDQDELWGKCSQNSRDSIESWSEMT